MASFTDTNPIKYNEYVGLPVDTYAQVGMYKQQQYDMGVQQVQSYISNVAGLDVLRDVDKQYLESKVNEVTSKINSFAGADWGNKSLVSKAAALAGSVAKDSYVENAVYSTQAIKSLMQSQKQLKEKNPDLYPTQAEWWDNKEVENYLKSTTVGEKYKGSKEATRHFGAKRDEDIRKALKDLSPSITTTIKPNGEYEYVYDKSTMITPAQIQNVVNGVIASNPEYQKSLTIDSLYSYKDYTPTDITKKLKTSLEQSEASTMAHADELEAFVKRNAATLTSEQIEAYKKQAADERTALAEYKTQMNSLFETLLSPNQEISSQAAQQIKQNLFKKDYVNTFVNNFKREEHDVNVKENINSVKDKEFFFHYLNAGLDPETKEPPVIGSKYYNLVQSKMRSKTNPDGPGSTVTVLPVAGETAKPMTATDLESEVSSLYNNLTNLDSNFLQAYSKKRDISIDEAKKYVAEQQERLRTGKPVDSDYMSFVRNKENANILYSAKAELLASVNAEAERQYPVKNLGVKKFNNLSFAVDYRGQNDFVNLLKQVRQDAITSLENKGIRLGKDVAGLNDFAISQEAKKLINNYKNNLNFKYLKEVVDKDFSALYSVITNPYDEQLKARNAYIDELLGKKNLTKTGVGIVVDENSKEQKELNSFVYSALQANPTFKDKDSVPKDIKSVNAVRDPVTNQINVTYIYKEGDKEKIGVQQLPMGTVTSVVPESSKYDILRNAVATSPTNKTASMLTENGKISFRIGRNDYDNNKNYYALFYSNGNWIPVPSLERSDISEVYEGIQRVSNAPEIKDLPPAIATTKILDYLKQRTYGN